ncbi:MAG: BTAD domain-containing putative transcriptional regulator, partial [Pseudomonadota bacterium]
MSRWIECLGGFALSDGGTPLPVAARKPQILLGLLAVARHRTLPRARLAALLWEYSDAESARVSLRQALARLRRAGGADLLEVEGDRVRLSASVSTDVDGFTDALSRGDDAEAARLYGGPFLDGTLPDGPDLEAAIVAERARLADLATGALRRELGRVGDRPDAAQAAHRLLSLDPLDEAAHRHLMRADAAHGARGAARARYEGLREALRRDLGTEPEAETTALMDRIRRAGLTDRTPAPPAPAAPPAADDPPLLLMALETDGAADWAAFQSTARAEGGRMVDCGPGEGAVLWPGTPLRDVANTALRMAAGSGDALSFGLVAEAGGAPSGAEPPTSGTFARARRVAARADPGEVWVSPDLAPRLGLATDGRGPAPLSPDATPERPVTPLVGRDLELAQTDSALAAARVAGTGLAIHLSGEAGIGKSRLAAEIVRREMAQGARVARVGFAPLGRGTRHVAQALMAALPPLPEDAIRDPATRAVGASLTGAAMSPEAELRLSALSGDVRRARMIDLLADAFDHAAASSDRLLVVIEDCHWAPTGIGGFLLDLCDRLTGSPVSFVLTERPHGADLGRRLAARARLGVVRLDLGPLAPGAAADLAAAVAADRADVAAVLDRAAGHPLFLLRLMEAGWSAGDLPASITGLVLEQIERLPPADRAALRRAAILGSAFDPAEVAAIFPDVSPPRPQGDLIHATETSLAFGHDLIRQAIHDAIPEESRRLWHGQAAAHYREVDPLRWADHALLGEDDAEACRAATAAANAMIADMRMTAAAGYIEAGLARGGDAEAVAELHSCRAGIRRMRGDLRGALADYRDAHAAATADRTRVAML